MWRVPPPQYYPQGFDRGAIRPYVASYVFPGLLYVASPCLLLGGFAAEVMVADNPQSVVDCFRGPDPYQTFSMYASITFGVATVALIGIFFARSVSAHRLRAAARSGLNQFGNVG